MADQDHADIYEDFDIQEFNQKAIKKLEPSVIYFLNGLIEGITCDFLSIIDDCESPIEKLFGLALKAMDQQFQLLTNGNFYMETQYNIKCGLKIFRADFYVWAKINDKILKIVVECDGHDFHERTKEQALRDKKRDRALLIHGYYVIHFTGKEIMDNPHYCVNELMSFILSR